MTEATMSDANSAAGQNNRRSVVYKRDKKTKASVIWADRFAGRAITIGGFAVIAAVFMIAVYLVYVAVPLLSSGEVTSSKQYALTASGGQVISTTMDEYETLGVELLSDGRVEAFQAATGERIGGPSVDFKGETPTAFARTLQGDDIALGFPDGTVRVGQLRIAPSVIPAKTLPEGLKKLPLGDMTDGKAIISPVPGGQVRRLEPQFALGDAVQVAPKGTPIRFLDYRVGGTSERPVQTFVSVDDKGVLRLSMTSSIVNMMTGETTTTVSTLEVPTSIPQASIAAVLLNTAGDRTIVATHDGALYRFDTRDPAHARLAEKTRILPEGVDVTAMTYLNGENSLIVAGADKSLSIWAAIDRKSKATSDGLVLTKIHDIENSGAAITRIAVSQRTRLFVASDEKGEVGLYHGTTARRILTLPADAKAKPEPVETLILSPRDNGALAISKEGTARIWSFHVPHPETTIQSLFGKVWYEGYEKPEYVWQSTGGTDDFEPKLSLVPLLVGTLKGTIYSLLLAIPLGVFGAMYLSQFMHPSYKRYVKPVIEIMAALPSVVLGFLAGLWLAPRVEKAIPGVFAMLLVVPLAILAAGSLWSLLPKRLRGRFPSGTEAFVFLFAIAGALWLCFEASPWVERVVFGGSFPEWLRSATGLAYDQRNAVVVGLAMGFAVIPIIFAIAEDAFSNVPRNLVAGSLALGANRWQTVTRVVLPTASPGIFSAVMIGFGRAIGETMIVLMATGNTPILDWNPFNGFRTLSANIAVEIPEAPMSSTLYRTLFLAALLLFALTFAVNTLAELVRQRLRQRYSQL